MISRKIQLESGVLDFGQLLVLFNDDANSC